MFDFDPRTRGLYDSTVDPQWRFGGPEWQLSGAPPGTVGNPASAGVAVSVGIGGLLLAALAGYGIWRLVTG